MAPFAVFSVKGASYILTNTALADFRTCAICIFPIKFVFSRGLTGVTTWESIDLLIDFLSQYVEILTYILDVFGSSRFRRFGVIFLNCLVCLVCVFLL